LLTILHLTPCSLSSQERVKPYIVEFFKMQKLAMYFFPLSCEERGWG